MAVMDLLEPYSSDLTLSASDAVNSENFARTLFSRNFAYAKFRENKTLAKWQNHFFVLIDIGKSCLNREFFTSLMFLLMLFAKIKLSRKLPNLQYLRLNLSLGQLIVCLMLSDASALVGHYRQAVLKQHDLEGKNKICNIRR